MNKEESTKLLRMSQELSADRAHLEIPNIIEQVEAETNKQFNKKLSEEYRQVYGTDDSRMHHTHDVKSLAKLKSMQQDNNNQFRFSQRAREIISPLTLRSSLRKFG